jgi:hypothetical protein
VEIAKTIFVSAIDLDGGPYIISQMHHLQAGSADGGAYIVGLCNEAIAVHGSGAQ